jgi:hypothetical protein
MMLLVYMCCRIQDMYNIVPQRVRFKVLLRVVEDEGVCPAKLFEEVEGVKQGTKEIFDKEDGEPIESVKELSHKFLLPYIRNSGIPPPYTPYSTKTVVQGVLHCLMEDKLRKE